jgi:hypothetical protein
MLFFSLYKPVPCFLTFPTLQSHIYTKKNAKTFSTQSLLFARYA